MTIQAAILLKKLKKAQEHQDNQIYIDFEEMTVSTVHEVGDTYTQINLQKYRSSIRSTLDYLKKLDCLSYNGFGQAKVTHKGWNAMSTTVQGAIKFTFRDIIVPIIVAIATTLLMRHI